VENYLNGKYFNPGNTNDYYNGNLPNITIIGGNNQSGLTNSWLPMPLTVQLTDTNALILTNAPVTFTLTQGGALIANSTNGTTTNILQIVTDLNGQAAVWLQLPSTNGTNIVIVSAQSGTNVVQVTFAEIAKAAGGLSPMAAVGGERIMELTANGDVVSWGGNQFGELGDYTHVDSVNPVNVVGLTNVAKISSGLSHSLAIDNNGALWAWGDDAYGQLGDGNENTNSNLPVQVLGMTNAVAAMAGGYETSAAVKSDGTVWTWGTTQINPIENPVTNDAPTEVAGLTNAVAVAAGEYHFLALLSNGTVWAWGQDGSGQLGNGNIGNYSVTPVQVTGLSNIVAICSGSQHNLALDTNGCVWAWGDNSYGELGDGGAENASATPIPVLTNITQIAAGNFHSLALDALGNLWAWGHDNAGQLGDAGMLISSSASIRPSALNVLGVGNDNAVQLDNFGLLSWSGSVSLPTQVLAFTNLVSIAAGSDATVVVDSSGNVWQCGSGDTDNADWSWEAPNGVPQLSPVYVDFFDGQLPNEQILAGNNQLGHGGMEFAQPMLFQLTDTNGIALSNAPVSVEVIYGDMELRTNSGGNIYKGLRLMTDTSGEVSVIGYADVNLVNTNCLVRVLAASQAQIAEMDFNETLIASPTLNILSPANGSTILLGTNEALAITVDAEAASGLSIQQVDYSYGTNGFANIPLSVSTASPFAFVWTNAEWWSNAFVGQYTLSAVAVDNSGGQSQPQNVTVTIALDTDGSGLPDYWQMEYFGQIGLNPDSSPDGNGQSLLYDYENGINPTNYYDGSVPVLQITGGNDQAGTYNSFLPVPATVYVTDAYGNILTNAPIEFTVTNGIALVAGSTSDVPTNAVVLRTGADGLVSAWIYFPASNANPPDSTILATAISGNNSVSVSFNEFVPMGYWKFDSTNTWVGEEGQLPLLATNIVGVPDWSSNGVSIESTNEAVLDYNLVETNGETNICLENGSILFWFQPAWSSANAAGTGPGHWARLLEVGDYNPAFTNGWWGLSVSPDGSELTFGTSTNGGGEINLSGSIS
ncbi:MAG TPA: Ig-like domain-containing protein, partial [Candidatus Acidoferrum sp.]|nr:Ig-like domain-containing protein [Candidatus Acidoferrum sp.]